MIICGLKVTHDGGVALIDDGRLIFSVEMEKLGNAERHAHLDDLAVAWELARAHGVDPGAVDALVVDGWRRTHKLKQWGGQDVALDLAPYRRGIVDDELLRPWHYSMLDQPYVSYPHYAGHFASAYCTSPFAGRPGYVLVWDGAMLPYLYRFDPQTRKARSLGPLGYLPGATYHHLSQMLPPYTEDVGWPRELALPGKIMAYIAHGTVDPEALDRLEAAYRRTCTELVPPGLADVEHHERLGRRVRERMRELLHWDGIAPQDALASIHEFMGSVMIRALADRLTADRAAGTAPGGGLSLAMAGGCALNIKWNSQVRELPMLDEVWVPPFPNDAGSALGTACAHMLSQGGPLALDWDVYAGPALDGTPPPVDGWTSSPCSVDDLAGLLHGDGRPVLMLYGRAELGPRALGHRSIIAPATDPAMKDHINTIKRREAYRPVAPICLEERAQAVFSPGTPDPFMLFEHQIRPDWEGRVPAVRHLDGSARLQTVSRRDDAVLHALLEAYERRSGIPVLCNSSANLPGRGFFPDLRSAMQWGQVPRIWSDGVLWAAEPALVGTDRSQSPGRFLAG